MRVRLVEPDPEQAAALRALLLQAGLAVDEAPEPEVLIVALPAAGENPCQAPRAPIVLLLGSDCADQVRPWISGRPRWISLSKPVRSSSLLAAIRGAAAQPGDAETDRGRLT